MEERAEWVVLVDESGNFDDPTRPVCVGGLVLRTPDDTALFQALRGAVERAMPHLRYPPHAAEFNRPSFHLIRWRGLSPEKRGLVDSSLSEPLEKAESLLAPLAKVPAALTSASSRPSFQALLDGDRWLEVHAPAAFRALKQVQDRCYRRLWELLSWCASTWQGMVIAAVESHGGPAFPASQSDRYLRLLATLVERLALMARATEPSPRIVLRVASRGVRRPEGAGELSVGDLRRLVEEVERPFTEGPLALPRLELVPMPPEPYDDWVHPGLVLADYAMNQLRSTLTRGEPNPLDPVLQATRFRLGMPAEMSLAGRERLPTLAADGAPRQALLAILAGTPPPELTAVRPGWAREQAHRCIPRVESLRARREEVAS